jgi:hypothetical protein
MSKSMVLTVKTLIDVMNLRCCGDGEIQTCNWMVGNDPEHHMGDKNLPVLGTIADEVMAVQEEQKPGLVRKSQMMSPIR